MVDIHSPSTEIRRGEKKHRNIEDRNHRAKIYWSALFHRVTIITSNYYTLFTTIKMTISDITNSIHRITCNTGQSTSLKTYDKQKHRVEFQCCAVTYRCCSLAILDPRVGHTMDVLSHLYLSSVILTDSSTESPVHDLMLSIQAVHGLPRLRTPGIVPCIISFSRQFPCFLMV